MLLSRRSTARNRIAPRGIVLRDVLTVLAILAIGLAVGAVIISHVHHTARRIADAAQIQSIHQGMVTWANHGSSDYPLPSKLDVASETVPEVGRAKDTSANIVSSLIYLGFVSPYEFVSVAEVNQSIKPCTGYVFKNPPSAQIPANALWDPAFSVDFTGGHTGNLSFALLQPSGQASGPGRIRMWQDDFCSFEAVIANRGPEVASVTVSGEGSRSSDYRVQTRTSTSNTFSIHGNGKTWVGNVGFNDHHVECVSGLAPPHASTNATPWPRYLREKRLDTLFYDEPDDPDHANAFLGIFTKAGEKPEDFKAIWD